MKICPNCHRQIIDNARFCSGCGAPQMMPGNYPVNQNRTPYRDAPLNKKKSGSCFPIVALILVVCIIVGVIGGRILYTRLIKPLIASVMEEEKPEGKKIYEDVKFTDLSYPKGDSDAFSIEPVEGITISGKEGALWEDTEITFEEIEDEEFYDTYSPALEAVGSAPLVAYDFDLGLKPEEAIPGTVELSFDLKELGIPENLWGEIEIYRQKEAVEGIEAEDPMDSFEKFVTDLSEEGTLTVSTSKNCAIWVAISALFVKVGAIMSIPLLPYVTVGGAITITVVYLLGRYWALPKYQRSEQYKSFKEDSTMRIEVREPYEYDVVVDLRNTELQDEYKDGGNYKNNQKALMDYSRELEDRAEKEYYKEITRRADNGKKEPVIIKWINTKKQREAAMKALDKASFMKEYIDNDEKLKELAARVEPPDSVKASIAMINQSYDYLKGSYIKLPKRVVEFDLLPSSAMGGKQSMGQKVKKLGIDSYMTLNIDTLVKNKTFNPEKADGFRLSCTHELFHVCQEEYVASEYSKDTRIEEATAGVLEMDASIHFHAEGIQTHDPDPEVSASDLDYVKRIENYCYGIPLNEYPLDYSNVSTKDKLIGNTPSWLINIGYTESDLIDFLRENKKYSSICRIMNNYMKDSGHVHFADILKKSFDIKSDDEWRELFQKFILSHETSITTETFSNGHITTDLAKCFPSVQESISGKGDVYVWEFKDLENVAYVKRFLFKDNKKNVKNEKVSKRYIAIAELDENSAKDKNVMFRLLDAGGGETVGDRNYTDPGISAMHVLFSNVYGKDERKLTLTFLFEPDEPKMALNKEKGAVKVSAPKVPQKLRKYGKVTCLRTVIADNKSGKQLKHDEPADSEKLGKALIFKLSDLGSSYENADLSCKQAWVYVDKDGKEYEGPYSGEKSIKNEEDPPEPEEPYEEREEPETEEDHDHFTKQMYVKSIFSSDYNHIGWNGRHYKDPVTITVNGDECTIMLPAVDEFDVSPNDENLRLKISPITIKVKGVRYRKDDDSSSEIYKGCTRVSITDSIVEEDEVRGFSSHTDPNEKSGLLFSREKYEFFKNDSSSSKNFYISYSSASGSEGDMVCGVQIPIHYIRTSQLVPEGEEYIWEDTPRYYDGKPYEKDATVYFNFGELRE